LIDISGHVTSDLVLDAVGKRVYLDQDPVYTQLWRAEYGKDLNFDRYDVFFTVGLNIGTPFSAIPDCGIHWHATLPPVVLDLWPYAGNGAMSSRCFSTVASLFGYSDLCFRGEWYQSKYEVFRQFADLPRRTHQGFEVLLKTFRDDDEVVVMLRRNGWRVRSMGDAATLSDYRHYIAESGAEIGIAKGAYVKGRSGWFSDRTAAYLACGRPALAHATGFERCLPTGQGLLCFDNVEEAACAVESIVANYRAHSRAARELAAEYLDARKVLSSMLDICTAALNGSSRPPHMAICQE
jgi:hypothetical protein